jgi:hypothetical protein
VDHLRSVIARVDQEYQVVVAMVEDLESQLERIQVQRSIPALALPASQIKKGLPGRLQLVKYLVHKLEDEIDTLEKKNKQVRLTSLVLLFCVTSSSLIKSYIGLTKVLRRSY